MRTILLTLFGILHYCATAVAQPNYEAGVISATQAIDDWHDVTLENTYSNPVVIMGPTTEFGSDPAGLRVRNVTSTGFQYLQEEFEENNGSHGLESFGYFVIEAGVYSVGGAIWEAGVTQSRTDDAQKTVNLAATGFDGTQVVLTQLASNNDPTALISRVRSVSATNFTFHVREEEALNQVRPATEDIHYLAVQQGSGTLPDGREYEVVSEDDINHLGKTAPFAASVDNPFVLAGVQTNAEDNPFFLRYRYVTDQGVEVRIQEETSLDPETDHNLEKVGFLVLERTGPEEQVFWYENFNNGTLVNASVDNGATAWNTDLTNLGSDGNNAFRVEGGQLTARNTDGEVVFRTEEVPISGHTNVKVAVQIRGEGSLESDDYIKVFYRIDDGPEIPLLNGLWRREFGTNTAMIGGLSGDKVEVIVRTKNTADDEEYIIDNIRIFTESDERHAIQDGNWNDPDTWSYTAGGPSCKCIPDHLSDTYIDGYDVILNVFGYTHNLTVYNNSSLIWTVDQKDLVLYGDATLDIKAGGRVDNGGGPNSEQRNIFFSQWTNEDDIDILSDRLGGSYPGVNVTINVDDPNGLRTRELSFNAAGDYVIQGSGNITLTEDLDVNYPANVTNNLSGTISIAQHFQLSHLNTNFTNNGRIEVADELQYEQGGTNIINNAALTIANDVVAVAGAALQNQTGSTLTLGGNLSSNLQLFAQYQDNEVHYNSASNQGVIAPQSAYWDLRLSNKGNSGSSEKRILPSSLDINGDVLLEGPPLGTSTMIFSLTTDKTLNLAGNWTRLGPSNPIGVTVNQGTNNERLIVDGSQDQTLARRETFNQVTIDKSAGSFLVAADAQLRINKEARFRNGVVETLGNAEVIFRENAAVVDASDDSHVKGTIVKQGDADFTFPAGDGTRHRPISVSGMSAPSEMTVDYYHDPVPNADLKENWIKRFNGCGYWEMSSSVSGTEASVTLHWDADCPVVFDEVGIVRWNGTQWVEVLTNAPVGTSTGGSITTTSPLSEFGRFALAQINYNPLTVDDSDTTNFATVLTGSSVLNNDNSVADNTLVASLLDTPGNGTVDLRSDGTYTYTPDAGFVGSDSFTYQTCDSGFPSACATATVTVVVRPFNYAPQAQRDSFSMIEDTVLEENLLTNDTDINAEDVLTVDTEAVVLPQHGEIVLQPNGNLVYTPAVNYFGPDSLAYRVCDNGGPMLCDTAWVIITIAPVNDAPIAEDDRFEATENETLNGAVTINDYDVEGETLGDVKIISTPVLGSLELSSDGRFVYVPYTGQVGTDQFTYEVCDSQDASLCSQATVEIIIQPGPLVIPKGFSPNGDGQGDSWQLQGISRYPGSIVTVFNRWGNMVYQVMGYDNRQVLWQGDANRGVRLGSQPLPEGTYFYVIDLNDGADPLSGYVVLKR